LKFDLALSHTVLEHVREPDIAFANICRMSRKYVITVVPFIQGFHFSSGNFGDFYRFTPMFMRSMHEENGFQVVRETYGPAFGGTIYLAYLGVRWDFAGSFFNNELEDLQDLNEKLGHPMTSNILGFVWRSWLLRIGRKAFLTFQRIPKIACSERWYRSNQRFDR
jgi:hypothetical protein